MQLFVYKVKNKYFVKLYGKEWELMMPEEDIKEEKNADTKTKKTRK